MQAARALADASLREGRAQSRLDGSLLAARKVMALLSETLPLARTRAVGFCGLGEGGRGGRVLKKSFETFIFFNIEN